MPDQLRRAAPLTNAAEISGRRPLTDVLAEAAEFAAAHGSLPITPDEFGIQRSPEGWQHATYIDATHAVSVTVDPDGVVAFAIAELNWVHDDNDKDRDICDYCEVLDPRTFAPPEEIDHA